MGPGRKICIVVPYATKTTAVVEGLALFRVKLSFTTVSIAFSCFFSVLLPFRLFFFINIHIAYSNKN